MTKTAPVFSMVVAQKLIRAGFDLVSIKQNKNGSGTNVFFFNDSEEFRVALQQHIGKK